MRIILAILALLCTPAAHAQGRSVDTLLALGLDVSGSVNEARWNVQRWGYAAALRNERVKDAILQKPIAVSLFQWARHQILIVPWTYLDSEEAIERVAHHIENMPRTSSIDETLIGSAVTFATTLLHESGYAARRRILDISGDGKETGPINAAGTTWALQRAREAALGEGVIINGLPILVPEGEPFTNPGIVEYYRDHVIGGAGSFIEIVRNGNDLEAFTKTLINKLLRELIADAR